MRRREFITLLSGAAIDRLNEAGTNTEPRLLANRLQRLVFRVRPVSSDDGVA